MLENKSGKTREEIRQFLEQFEKEELINALMQLIDFSLIEDGTQSEEPQADEPIEDRVSALLAGIEETQIKADRRRQEARKTLLEALQITDRSIKSTLNRQHERIEFQRTQEEGYKELAKERAKFEALLEKLSAQGLEEQEQRFKALDQQILIIGDDLDFLTLSGQNIVIDNQRDPVEELNQWEVRRQQEETEAIEREERKRRQRAEFDSKFADWEGLINQD